MDLLITSGAYLTPELESEFGRIPPAFLPVGNRRLFEWQLQDARDTHARAFITLPADFDIDPVDEAKLHSFGATILRVDPNWSLGRSVHSALLRLEPCDGLCILYGDTRLKDWPSDAGQDWIAVGQSTDFYDWHVEAAATAEADSADVWVGAFCFSKPDDLCSRLRKDSDFIEAVESYAALRGYVARPIITEWLDFGHVNTYYKSRTQMTTQRSFNELQITDGIVIKRSSNRAKMRGESNWLASAPMSIKPYLPAFYGTLKDDNGQMSGYAIEYLTTPSLSDLYVFGRLPSKVWRGIFKSCDKFIQLLSRTPVHSFDIAAYCDALYRHKTILRLQEFAQAKAIDLDKPWYFNGHSIPPLMSIVQDCLTQVLQSGNARPSLVHGDLCFSNLLYDFRSGSIKSIDPRGLGLGDEPEVRGDLRYDIAKLCHSIIGLYDHIIADRFTLEFSPYHINFHIHANHLSEIQSLFLNDFLPHLTTNTGDEYPIMILLFLSMLPLHADSMRRQQALLANALRLYANWKDQQT